MKTIKLKNGVELNLTKEQEKELLSQLEKKQGRWKPEKNEKYYYIYNRGVVDGSIWHNEDYDNFNYSIGNVYRTEAEAQEALDTGWVARLQAEQRIRDYIIEKGYDTDVDWSDEDQIKHIIWYDYGVERLQFGISHCCKNSNLPYFKKQYDAEDTLEHCIEDYMLLLGVE